MIPMVVTVIMMRPKCTGSTPMSTMTGTRMGVISSAMTVVSMNMPENARMTTAMSIIRMGLSVTPTRKADMFCGTWS